MTMPTDKEIRRAWMAGRLFARAGKPLTDGPYNANGDGRQRVLARSFVRGYAAMSPEDDVDFGE